MLAPFHKPPGTLNRTLLPGPLQDSATGTASPLCTAALSRAAGEVRAFRADRMVDVCRFVAATQTALEEEGAAPPGAGQDAAAAAAGWPVARWQALSEAAGAYERLVGMGLELGQWQTDERVRTAAAQPSLLLLISCAMPALRCSS